MKQRQQLPSKPCASARRRRLLRSRRTRSCERRSPTLLPFRWGHGGGKHALLLAHPNLTMDPDLTTSAASSDPL
jgi:hypothetical protein